MTQPNVPAGGASSLELKGGAAIVAPAAAFQGGVPPNALVVVPLTEPKAELTDKLKDGALAVTRDQMWELLGFNGPAVTVQDQQGRPITIGLEDLLDSLKKNWETNAKDLNAGRIYASELMKHGRPEPAAGVLAKVVASGGGGDDWLGLGVAQLAAEQMDKAESTLKGAQNLLADSPFPSLHLAKVYRSKEDYAQERTQVERAISIDANCVDAWAYLFSALKDRDGDEKAIAEVVKLADAEPNKKSAAPFVAIQGFFSSEKETLDKALEYAQKGLDRNPDDPLALVCVSALLGQRGDLPAVISLLQKHEGKMVRDVRLANNYFEALMQTRDMDKVTKLLNALMASPQRDVKQFAAERSRAVAQLLQAQQQRLQSGGGRPAPRSPIISG